MPRQFDVTQTKLVLEPYQVINRPIVTEKGYDRAEHDNIYTFEVNKMANKQTIKEAIEKLFEVKVLEVNIQNRKGKKRRTRYGIGNQRSWKKAFVKLDENSRINIF